MQATLENAVTELVSKSTKADKSDDAMKYAQAALSLAHALATLEGAKR